jgi:hypothetical protein
MIFHPMILPSLAMIILLTIPSYVSFSIPAQARRLIVGLVFINTCVGPMLVILLMKRIGLISDIFLDSRSERLYPILVSVLFYLFTWYLFRQANIPSLLNHFIVGATSLVLIGLIVTNFWKISLHMMSMGGFTGYMIALSMILDYEMPMLIIGSILVSGMLGSARIKLNAHNPAQVYVGWITGIAIMLMVIFYLRG